ncbi:MAG: endonuclease/exonuclease/phosphatase family protein [Bacillota bacterium]
MVGNNDETPKPARRWIDWLGMAVVISCWSYVAMGVAFWLLMWVAADRWWVATALMFGPRWVLLVPLAVLIPAVLAIRWQSMWVLGLGMVIVLGPVMGFRVPWRRVLLNDGGGLRVRMLTCNIHRHWLKGPELGRLIDGSKVDVVALQEWSSRHEGTAFAEGKWYTLRDAELFLASRYPIRKVKELIVEEKEAGIAVCYEVQTPRGPVYVVNLHLVSPHPALESLVERDQSAIAQVRANMAKRREESRIISAFAAEVKGPILLAGDFNMPTDSTTFQRYWSGFTDAFCEAGTGFGFTYYSRLMRTRIDHILGGSGWQCRRSWVGPAVGSPHRPVIAEMEWVGQATGVSRGSEQ